MTGKNFHLHTGYSWKIYMFLGQLGKDIDCCQLLEVLSSYFKFSGKTVCTVVVHVYEMLLFSGLLGTPNLFMRNNHSTVVSQLGCILCV